MKAVRVKEPWQLAGVHYVRTETMVKGFRIPLYEEFDERDSEKSLYVLVLDDIDPVAACRIRFSEGEEEAKRVAEICVNRGWRLSEIQMEKVSMDEIFAQLSGKRVVEKF